MGGRSRRRNECVYTMCVTTQYMDHIESARRHLELLRKIQTTGAEPEEKRPRVDEEDSSSSDEEPAEDSPDDDEDEDDVPHLHDCRWSYLFKPVVDEDEDYDEYHVRPRVKGGKRFLNAVLTLTDAEDGNDLAVVFRRESDGKLVGSSFEPGHRSIPYHRNVVNEYNRRAFIYEYEMMSDGFEPKTMFLEFETAFQVGGIDRVNMLFETI